MTISGPAVPIFCMYLVAAERQGADLSKLDGTLQTDIFKEYIAQKEWLFAPEPHLRLIGDLMEYCAAGDPEVQAAVGQRLPHPGGRFDRRAGAGVHAGRRLRVRRARPVPRPRRQRVRARAELLLRRAHRLLRGDRQVPRRPPHLGPAPARRLRRDQREGAVAEVPHADRRGQPDRPAAGQQRGADRRRGAGRGARRDELAAHQRARRDARAAHRRVGRDRPAHPAGADGGDRRGQRGRPARRLVVSSRRSPTGSRPRPRRSSPGSARSAPTAASPRASCAASRTAGSPRTSPRPRSSTSRRWRRTRSGSSASTRTPARWPRSWRSSGSPTRSRSEQRRELGARRATRDPYA